MDSKREELKVTTSFHPQYEDCSIHKPVLFLHTSPNLDKVKHTDISIKESRSALSMEDCLPVLPKGLDLISRTGKTKPSKTKQNEVNFRSFTSDTVKTKEKLTEC